ncbi:MAG: NAD(P)H-dependent glycerol-3-phosphate dehydrogenase [Planctomycetes bacterium]|nr:NAD(P)H-dependent glycerol-3-phosphate dehydrogenase [Planctomycetota bacterium]
MKIGFVGLGNVGTALANMIAHNGYEVLGWEYDKNVVKEINSRHTNEKFLKGFTLHSKLIATQDLENVFTSYDIIFIGVHTRFISKLLTPFQGKETRPDLIITTLSKGIDPETGLTSSETISSLFPDKRRAVISGPSIANEVAKQMPTVLIAAGTDKTSLTAISKVLQNEYFKVYLSDDMIGTEFGGILKNVYAMGSGIIDGFNLSSANLKAIYLAQSFKEMIILSSAFGAKRESTFLMSGLGDLLATSLSTHSHNRTMGELLASGANIREIESKMKALPEGYSNLKIVIDKASKLNTTIPVAETLLAVIEKRADINQFISTLLQLP